MPDSVWVPPPIIKLPDVPPPMPPSAMTPANVVEPAATVSACAPSATLPEPIRVAIEAPVVVCEMSKVPLSKTTAEVAIEPVPLSASVAPPPISVSPV